MNYPLDPEKLLTEAEPDEVPPVYGERAPVLFLKAHVKAHRRRGRDGRVVFVRDYHNSKPEGREHIRSGTHRLPDPHTPDLFVLLPGPLTDEELREYAKQGADAR